MIPAVHDTIPSVVPPQNLSQTGSVPIPIDIGIGIAILAIILVSVIAVRNLLLNKKSMEKDQTKIQIASYVLCALFSIFTCIHIFYVPSLTLSAWSPDLDGMTIQWMVVAGIAYILPWINEITFGSASIKLRQELQETQKIGDKLLDEATDYTQHWNYSLSQYLADLDTDDSINIPARFDQFLYWRLNEALEWNGPKEDSHRISLWLANPETHKIEYALDIGFERSLFDDSFSYTEGVIGVAFTEHVTRNELSPSSKNRYGALWKSFSNNNDSNTKGSLLAVPLMYGKRCLGVMCLDRPENEYWEKPAIDMLEALACIIAIAIVKTEEIGN